MARRRWTTDNAPRPSVGLPTFPGLECSCGKCQVKSRHVSAAGWVAGFLAPFPIPSVISLPHGTLLLCSCRLLAEDLPEACLPLAQAVRYRCLPSPSFYFSQSLSLQEKRGPRAHSQRSSPKTNANASRAIAKDKRTGKRMPWPCDALFLSPTAANPPARLRQQRPAPSPVICVFCRQPCMHARKT